VAPFFFFTSMGLTSPDANTSDVLGFVNVDVNHCLPFAVTADSYWKDSLGYM